MQIGRWLSVDPLAEEFSDESPYTFGHNNPVRFNDLDGRSGWDVIVGAAIAITENIGGPNLRESFASANAADYNAGLNVGDAVTEAIGAGLIVAGEAGVGGGAAGLMGAGGLAMATVGAATPVVAPLATASVGVMLAGGLATGAGRLLMARSSDSPKTTSRAGKDFTPSGKQEVVEQNRQKNGGKVNCEHCGTETTTPAKSQKGKTPPSTDRQVDHITPKSKGGAGEPSNGQILCRTCNRVKSDH